MEDVRVTWNDFEYNLKGSFAKLRDDQVLFDMSLVCDSQIIPAHQVVLGCCSPQLLELLTGARAAAGPNHPLLVLRGVAAADMHLILQFVYTGQVVVPQQRLNTFLAAAEDLEILGLSKKCANIHIGDLEDDLDFGLPELPAKRKAARSKKRKQPADTGEYGGAEIKQEENGLDDNGSKMKREKFDKMFECDSCDKKFARKAHLQRHEKAHSDFRPFVCTICEQKFKRKEHCFKHIATIHDIEDPTAHTEEIKLSEVLEAIENANSEDDSHVHENLFNPGLNLSKETIS